MDHQRKQLRDPTTTCDRRRVLQIGASAALGISLTDLFARSVRASLENAKPPRAKSVLLVFVPGGPSHLDTFDMKPSAPAEVRGEFQEIATNVPGIGICEHLPRLAAQMHQLAVVRTMNCASALASHETGTHAMLTGINSLPPGSQLYASRMDWPCYAAGVDRALTAPRGLPSGVSLPFHLNVGGLPYCGQNAGLLGAIHDPWQLKQDPTDANYAGDPALNQGLGLSADRISSRRNLLATLERQQSSLQQVFTSSTYDQHQQRAAEILTSGRLGRALRFDDEPVAVRERYGRHRFGQSLLLARRVVETGVPIVQVNLGMAGQWDTHANNFKTLSQYLLPPFDQALSSLLVDMQTSGLLQETLVIITGEFGRTPKIGGNVGTPSFSPTGRDHWTACFCSVFAGAGVRGGTVIGQSDHLAAYPTTKSYTPADLGATVYQSLGVPANVTIEDRLGRPLRLNDGNPIAALSAS